MIVSFGNRRERRAGGTNVMHELSIAQSLIELLSDQLADYAPARATNVIVQVGELSGVVPAALLTAFTIARQGTPLQSATLTIEPVRPRIWCDRCVAEQPAESVQNLACTVCGQPSNDVRAGRELDVTHMELIDPPREPADAV